jgi:hypothetical protein
VCVCVRALCVRLLESHKYIHTSPTILVPYGRSRISHCSFVSSYTHTRTHARTHARTHTHTHTHTRHTRQTHTHTHVYIYKHICTHYTHTHTHTRLCDYTRDILRPLPSQSHSCRAHHRNLCQTSRIQQQILRKLSDHLCVCEWHSQKSVG